MSSRRLLPWCAIVFMAACARPPRPPVEDLSGRENLSSYTLEQVRGTRVGDRLDSEATFGDGSSTLTVEMRFAIGAPTKLASGRWQWTREGRLMSGTVAERSVMFLADRTVRPASGAGSICMIHGSRSLSNHHSDNGVEAKVAARITPDHDLRLSTRRVLSGQLLSGGLRRLRPLPPEALCSG